MSSAATPSGMPMAGLILLHGFLGAPDDFDQLLVEARSCGHSWADGIQCLALADLATTQQVRALGIHALAAGVLRWLHGRGDGATTVVGYSLGARVALRALAHDEQLARCLPGHARLIGRCVLLSGSGGLESTAERAARAALDDARAAALQADGLESFVDSWYEQPMFASLRAHAGFGAVRHRRAAGDAQWWSAVVKACSPGRSPSDWATIQEAAPRIRTIIGSMDRAYATMADRMTTLGVAPAASLAGAGHAVHLEAPAACSVALEQACA